MARKSVEREFEENLERDLLDQAVEALSDGARESGATLTRGECAILLKELPPIWSRGWRRWELIAQFSFQQEDGPGSVEAAIKTTMQKFDVSRQTVFDARRRRNEYLAYVRSRSESN